MKFPKVSFKLDNENALPIVAYSVVAIFLLYTLYKGEPYTLLLATGMSMIVYSLTSHIAAALLSGVFVGLIALYSSRSRKEGFENEEEEENEEEKEGFENEHDEEQDEEKETETEGFTDKADKADKPKKKKAKRTPPPDNADRAEMFTLGKKYKAPKEEDDAEFHLDAGTTFLNAYKSLKPDQVAAMTKDTQDLMNTQKQLMTTLHTLKPLIKDGKDMMDMFQGYFGAGAPSGP